MASADEIVYVVDDDARVRSALSRLFRSAGLRAETFGSAREFLECEREDAAACLVLDLQMPGMDGLALQQELAETGADLPIVFLSGHGDVPTSVAAMKRGAADFLTKPCADGLLLETVRRSLERHRARRAERANLDEIRRRYATLTPREREVLAHVVGGALNKQTAAELGTSEKTVKVHRGRVMRKMGAESLAELVRLADRLGVGRAGDAGGPGPGPAG